MNIRDTVVPTPTLDDTSMAGARGLLINITGGPDLTLFEVDEAANRVRDEVDPQANIIFGSAFDESLKGRVRVSVFATGIDRETAEKPKSEPQRPAADGGQRRAAGRRCATESEHASCCLDADLREEDAASAKSLLAATIGCAPGSHMAPPPVRHGSTILLYD